MEEDAPSVWAWSAPASCEHAVIPSLRACVFLLLVPLEGTDFHLRCACALSCYLIYSFSPTPGCAVSMARGLLNPRKDVLIRD